MKLRGSLYRVVMRIAHRFHWHYAPPIYPEGGFRQTIRSSSLRDLIGKESEETNG
jgi:hypothetical protein